MEGNPEIMRGLGDISTIKGITNKQKQTHSHRKQTYGYQRGKRQGRNKQEFGMNIYTLLYIKQITNKDLLYSTQYFVIASNRKEFKTEYEYAYTYIYIKYTYTCICACQLVSYVLPFATPWTVAHQTPLSMGFSRQEYWSRQPVPSPGDLPSPRSNSGLLHCRQTLHHVSHQGSPYMHKAIYIHIHIRICLYRHPRWHQQ